jgi:hypothetical protein
MVMRENKLLLANSVISDKFIKQIVHNIDHNTCTYICTIYNKYNNTISVNLNRPLHISLQKYFEFLTCFELRAYLNISDMNILFNKLLITKEKYLLYIF